MRLRLYLIVLVTWLLPAVLFAQSVHIGDILCTDGAIVSAADFPSSGRTAWGIVFYVDDNDAHGWAVALHNQSSSIKWSSSNYYGYDIPNLVNYENARAAMHNLDGSQNTGIIRNTSNSTNFPAAWVVDYDDGWFLPSAAQLRYMYSYYPEINASLQVVGGSPFPLDGNYYWWSSSEVSGYHAYDMNSGGSIGDYVKDNHVNYPPNGIAVRQIRDFNIPNVVPATYHIGDLITNDDGSQGILFYLSPDQTEGWMVALNDASTSISWGSGDVPGLDNQTYSSPFGMLLNETDGYANTGIIRDYQNGMNTAANAVDYEHGWYLPTAGQLSKLFGALPFVEYKLQAYGSILAQAEYWSSSEANANEAFAVTYRPAGNVRAGGFIRSDKNQNYHVRAVRNLSPTPLPIVGEIVTPESICENGVLTLQVPETQFATSEGWQMSPTITFDNPSPYHGEPLDASYNGWFFRYFAANASGIVYSNVVNIAVWPKYETSINVMACTHYVWNGIDYNESGVYEQSFTSIHGCDSIVTMNFTVADVVTNEWTVQTCDSLTWNDTTYTEPGDYVQVFTTMQGCDSTVILHLVPDDYPAAIPEINGLQEVYVSTDIILGKYNYFIDPVGFASHYEWILEGPDWIMDTTETHCTLWVTLPGTATLKVRAWNGCGYTEKEIIIHAGFFDIEDNQTLPVAVYPNPAHDKVFIESEDIVRVRLYDLLGQCLTERSTEPCDRMELSLQDYANSIYLIEIQTKRGIIRTKLKISPQ